MSVVNNAAWAVGEIALKHGSEMAPWVPHLLQRLIPLLHAEKMPRTLLENSGIALARLGLVCPTAVAPHLNTFILPWCHSLRALKDNPEKESAYLGICALIQLNPQAVIPSFVYWADAIVSWNDPSQTLKNSFVHVLNGVRGMMGDEMFLNHVNAFPAPVRQKLSDQYQI